MSRRLLHERRCDCVSCFCFRAAAALFLTGLGVLMLLAALIARSEREPLLIDNVAADGSVR